MKNAIINARVESELKTNVEGILKNLGLTATQAITIFYQQIKLNNGLPFEVKIPNDETVTAMEEALKGDVESVTIETLRENLVHK
jgi:DNA-damage-inducible protein J